FREVERDGELDAVAVEEPLEIRVDGEPLAVTMRTPGHDEELALGFLYGEGLIDGPRRSGRSEVLAGNIVGGEGPLLPDPGARRFYATSSCGVCGKGALEEVAVHAPPLPPPAARPRVPRALPRRRPAPGAAAARPPARPHPATTRWTRRSAARCSTASSRSTSASCASAAAC